MEIEKSIQQLVELERHVRELDTLIQAINSMSDEELKNELPRILKAQRALESRGKLLPAPKRFVRQLSHSDQDSTSFRKLFLRRLWSLKER